MAASVAGLVAGWTLCASVVQVRSASRRYKEHASARRMVGHWEAAQKEQVYEFSRPRLLPWYMDGALTADGMLEFYLDESSEDEALGAFAVSIAVLGAVNEAVTDIMEMGGDPSSAETIAVCAAVQGAAHRAAWEYAKLVYPGVPTTYERLQVFMGLEESLGRDDGDEGLSGVKF